MSNGEAHGSLGDLGLAAVDGPSCTATLLLGKGGCKSPAARACEIATLDKTFKRTVSRTCVF
jgi:hypothetical protein